MTANYPRVQLCPLCEGHPRDRFGPGGQCWNCHRSPRYCLNPNDPGPGYVLRGEPIQNFPPGAIVIDVYRGDSFQVVRHAKGGYTVARCERDGQQWDVHQPDPRYLTPEEYNDPATWTPPERPQPVQPTNDTRETDSAGSLPAQRVSAAKSESCPLCDRPMSATGDHQCGIFEAGPTVKRGTLWNGVIDTGKTEAEMQKSARPRQGVLL